MMRKPTKINRLLDRAKESLRRGLGKAKFISAFTIGFLGGIFPVLGTTTVLCAAMTFVFRTNHAIVQLINWAVYPLQIMFLVPFLKYGSDLLGGQEFSFTISQIKDAFGSGFFQGIEMIGLAHVYGILLWLIIAIPLGLILVVLLNVFYLPVRKIVTSD